MSDVITVNGLTIELGNRVIATLFMSQSGVKSVALVLHRDGVMYHESETYTAEVADGGIRYAVIDCMSQCGGVYWVDKVVDFERLERGEYVRVPGRLYRVVGAEE